MPKLPMIDLKQHANHSPHLVILGAGASRAATPGGDRNGARLPLMSDFVETVGLQDLLSEAGISWRNRNFEDLYDELSSTGEHTELLQTLEVKVFDYFASLDLPQEATLYDYLLLCLREKDVIATFNWDPFLAQAYRRNVGVRRLPTILFLHGNVAIGVCLSCRVKGYADHRCGKCGRELIPTKLLYPIGQKDYTSDPFIQAEWKELQHYLEYAYFLTIFGYAAPRTDAAAVELMRSIWDENETRSLAQVEIIDIRAKKQLYATWESFITRDHYYIVDLFSRSYIWYHPRRTCDAFAWATLQLDPWRENTAPQIQTVSELQGWIAPLIREEAALEESGTPLSGLPCSEIYT